MKKIIVIMVLVLSVFHSLSALANADADKLPSGNVVMPISYNIATKAKASANDNGGHKNGDNISDETTSAQNAIDGIISPNSAWVSANDAIGPQTLEITFDKTYILTGISLFIGKGYDINSFSLKYYANGSWNELSTAAETTERENAARYPIDPGISSSALQLSYQNDGSVSVEELEVYGYVPESSSYTQAETSSAAYTDISDSKMKNIVNRLCSLGIMLPDKTNEFRADEYITRGEFTKEVLNLFAVKNTYTATSQEDRFIDVGKSHKYYRDIELAASLGYVSGYNGLFRPDDNTTFNEAVKMLVVATGFELYAQQNGGYPAGYHAACQYIGVKFNISAKVDDYITRGQAAVILNEMLEADAFDDTAYLEQYPTIRRSDESILGKFHDAYIEYGIVEAVGKTTVTASGDISPDGIRINGIMYSKGNVDASDYLGRSVKFVYKEVKGDRNIILYMEPRSYDKVLDIPGESIFEVNDNSTDSYEVKYELDGSEKRIRLPKAATMLYNGDVLSGYKAEHLLNKSGKIRLIDNDNDGKYNIIIVDEVSSMRVHAVDYDNEVIYGINNIELNLSGSEYVIENKGGLTTLQSISTDSVISYKKENKDKYYIYVIDEHIIGNVSGVRNDANSRYIRIDDIEYKLSSYYMLTASAGYAIDLKIGDSGDFYINQENEIVWADIKSSSDEYALLLKAYTDEGDHCYFKLVDKNGNKVVLENNDRLTSNIVPGKTKPAATEVVAMLQQVQTVVIIKRTSTGMLTSIKYCENSVNIDNSDWSNTQRTLFTSVNIKNAFDRSSRKTPWLDNVYMLDENGTLFSFEKDSNGRIIERTIYVTASNAYYKGTIYDVDFDSRVAKAVAIERVAERAKNDGEEEEADVIDNRGEQKYESFVFLRHSVYNDSERGEIYKIRGYFSGKEKEFELNDYISETKINSLTYGDIISIKLDKDNKVTDWTKVIDLDGHWSNVNITASTSRGGWYQLNGYPSYIENGYMVIGEGIAGTPMSYSPSLMAYVYDFKAKKVYLSTAAEISMNDYVLFNMYKFGMKDAIILKDYKTYEEE